MVLERPKTMEDPRVPPSWPQGGVGSFVSVVALEESWMSVPLPLLIVERSMAAAKLSFEGMGASTLNVGVPEPPKEAVETPPPGGGVEMAKSLVLPKGPRALAGIVALSEEDDLNVVASLSFPPGPLKNGFKITMLSLVKFVPVTVIGAGADGAGGCTGALVGEKPASVGNKAS